MIKGFDRLLRAAAAGWLVFMALMLASCHGVPSTSSRPRPLSSYDDQVKALLGRMTLAEKIGQMIQADVTSLADPNDVETYYLGSLLSGGGSDPATGNTLKDWADMVDTFQQHALRTRLGIPILYGADAVHGHNNVLGAVIFPHNVGLGCTRDPRLVEQIGRITAEEMRATGVRWTFAPCVTVPRDERWGRTFEGFSEDPQLVGQLDAASVRGLQGTDLSDPGAVAACAKHYVADGGTTAVIYTDRPSDGNEPTPNNFGGAGRAGRSGVRVRLDQGNAEMDEDTLRRIHLPPYEAAIRAGVLTIMSSYSSWNGVRCTASKRLLTEILKEELGFEGVLISDYYAINQVHPDYKTAIGICVNAGMDMGMVPREYKEFSQYLKELVEEGVVPMSRINDAVTRILRVKFALGLMDPKRTHMADRGLWASFGSAEHRQVARRAVRESLVLLKNEHKTLPLSKKAIRIHVAGEGADNIGIQCGGWTIHWQGQNGEVTPGGTTILAAIRQTVCAHTEVTYSADGSGAQDADVGVVVIGERPYAEGLGDNADLALLDQDVRVVDSLKQAGIPVVVILLSGRPMIINNVLDKADAFIAAWLPGTEGQGVADVLFGDFKPKGRLSYTWPRSIDQVQIHMGDEVYDPLFAYGFGLSY